MPKRPDSPVAKLLAKMIGDSAHGSRWHTLGAAAAGLRKPDMDYAPRPEVSCDLGMDPWGPDLAPVRSIMTPRRLLTHIAEAAGFDADYRAPLTRKRVEGEWDSVSAAPPSDTPADATQRVDVALRRLHARADMLTDADLPAPTNVWHPSTSRSLLLVDGGILHPAWHLGQLAMLPAWRRGHRRQGEVAEPVGPKPRLSRYPGSWDRPPFPTASRTDACLGLLAAAYQESPIHSLRLVLKNLSHSELHWRPFPVVRMPRCPGLHTLIAHLADCKIMYANHGFGDRTFTSSEAVFGRGWWGESSPPRLLAALGKAHDYLVEHVASATDGDLDQRRTMHSGVPHTGWQVAACMAKHDAWHAGQAYILRAAHAARHAMTD